MVRAQLEFYHTQPDRLPEPEPVPMPHACVPTQISDSGPAKPLVWDASEVMAWQKHNPNITIHDVGFGCGRDLMPHCNGSWGKAWCPFVTGKPVGNVVLAIMKQRWRAQKKEGNPEANVSVTHCLGSSESPALTDERDRAGIKMLKNKEEQVGKSEKTVEKEKTSAGKEKEKNSEVELKEVSLFKDSRNDEHFQNNDKKEYWGYFWAAKIDCINVGNKTRQEKTIEETDKGVRMVRPGICILDGSAGGELILV